MKARLFSLILLASVCFAGYSQESHGKFIVKGTVIDASGNPVGNGIVMVDGNQTNSVTNSAGKYRVKVSREAETIGILTLSNGMIGELIAGRNEIDFRYGTQVLNPDQSQGTGEEAVNTGYGTVRRKDLTTDIDKIDGTDKKFKSYSSIFEMIQRECSGVAIQGRNVIIQDSRNMAGSVQALYVVDGTYVDDISYISPRVVESVQVLKGTSAAIYGSRGYGGAVVITTKKKE